MTTNEKVISVLNHIIEICNDGEQGFAAASQDVKQAELKALFMQYSKQRVDYARELKDEVCQLGGNPEQSGSVAGALHRGWINLKAAVTGGDEDAIVAECERGEDEAKEAYEKALNAYLPANITGVIQRQYTQIKEAHDRLRAMQKAVR